MRPLLFVPGFQENQQSRDYESVLRVFRDNGYAPQFVEIDWHRTTQVDWVRQLESVRSAVGFDAALAGFSFGAVTALLSAAHRSPSELWLFSLSTLFAESKYSWTRADSRIIGKRRLALAAETPFAHVAAQVTCQT